MNNVLRNRRINIRLRLDKTLLTSIRYLSYAWSVVQVFIFKFNTFINNQNVWILSTKFLVGCNSAIWFIIDRQ